jgi:hypothetical protein
MRSRGRGGVISDTGIGHAVTVLASRLAMRPEPVGAFQVSQTYP